MQRSVEKGLCPDARRVSCVQQELKLKCVVVWLLNLFTTASARKNGGEKESFNYGKEAEKRWRRKLGEK